MGVNRWCRGGIFRRLFNAIVVKPDCDFLLVNSILMRAHQQSAGAKKGNEAQASGWSVGGISGKTQLANDVFGNLVRLVLTGGPRNDIPQIEVLRNVLKTDFMLASKGDDGACAMQATVATGVKPLVLRRSRAALCGCLTLICINIVTSWSGAFAKSNTSAGPQHDMTNWQRTIWVSPTSSVRSLGAGENQRDLVPETVCHLGFHRTL